MAHTYEILDQLNSLYNILFFKINVANKIYYEAYRKRSNS